MYMTSKYIFKSKDTEYRLYKQTQRVSVSNAVVSGSFPSPEAKDMIFLTAAVISLALYRTRHFSKENMTISKKSIL